jgi:hypothetical protein
MVPGNGEIGALLSLLAMTVVVAGGHYGDGIGWGGLV